MALPQKPPKDESLYYTWSSDEDKKKVLKQVDANIYEVTVASRAIAQWQNFTNFDTNVSVKTGFGRSDYNYFRSNEAVPARQKEKIAMSCSAYDNVGIIRNIIDLMGDFTCQGICLSHPEPQVQKFYRQWFKKIKGADRSERFANLFYRMGSVVVSRATAKLRPDDIKKLRKTVAGADIEMEEAPKVGKGEIPMRYSFLNPLSLEVIGGSMAQFVGKVQFALKIDNELKKRLNGIIKPEERELFEQIPAHIIDSFNGKDKLLRLDPNKVRAFYYKKDDWEIWAKPMLQAILDDIGHLEKMKLADIAALDGIISQIRVWKLGSLEEKMFPTQAAITKLANQLMNNPGGGVLDLIWGPELSLIQTTTDAHHFLGEEKYKPVMAAIFQGIGIPPTLSGSDSKGGFTNNFVSLKTLVERLNYGRAALREFWDYEIALVQKAMGFSKPATVSFGHTTLSDEAAEKALWRDLVDRGLLSVETLLERFGESPELELARIKREDKARETEKMPRRAGPFYEGEYEEALTKIALQQKLITPKQAGMELEADSQEPIAEQMVKVAKDAKKAAQKAKKTGVSGQGRPKNSKDSGKRKQKRVLPRSKAEYNRIRFWSKSAQNKIAEIFNPIYLAHANKTNMRKLTNEESTQLEQLKFAVLCALNPFEDISVDRLQKILASSPTLPSVAHNLYQEMKIQFVQSVGNQPTTDDLRDFQAEIYALINSI